ncbi:MAG: MFS transporter, partial [Bauldia sp.]
LPLLLQVAFDMTAFESGLVTFVTAIGAMAMKFVAVPILRRFGFKTVLIGTSLVAGVFTGIPAIFTPMTPLAVMLTLLLIGGFFRSLQFTSLNSIAYDEVTPERMSRATSMTSVFQQLSLSVGISYAAIALTLSSGGSEILERTDFIVPFIAIGGVVALSALVYFFLPKNAGAEMSGHGKAKVTAAEVGDVPDRATVP